MNDEKPIVKDGERTRTICDTTLVDDMKSLRRMLLVSLIRAKAQGVKPESVEFHVLGTYKAADDSELDTDDTRRRHWDDEMSKALRDLVSEESIG